MATEPAPSRLGALKLGPLRFGEAKPGQPRSGQLRPTPPKPGQPKPGSRTPSPTVDLNWFDNAVEAPRPGTTDTRRLANRQRLFRWYVWGSIVATPLLAFLSLAEVAGHKGASAGAAGAQASTPGETAGWQAVQGWLGQSPSPLPGGHVVAWTGATSVPTVHLPKSSSSQAGPPEDAQLEHFLVVGRGGWYHVDVEVIDGPDGESAAISGPSFLPVGPAASGLVSGASPWPGLSPSASVPTPVSNAINSWLAAYTSGNAQTLLQSTGDPSINDAYLPLTGVSQASVANIAAAAAYGPQGQMIVEAQLYIVWRGQPAGNVFNQGVLTTMDLLVERATTATPVVVAWGPPGSGTSLRPYQDAVPASLAQGQGA